MVKKQFLDLAGLKAFVKQLPSLFATKDAVTEVKATTDPYIFEIDYTKLEFDTDLIVSGGASSSTIDIGQVGFMIIAES